MYPFGRLPRPQALVSYHAINPWFLTTPSTLGFLPQPLVSYTTPRALSFLPHPLPRRTETRLWWAEWSRTRWPACKQRTRLTWTDRSTGVGSCNKRYGKGTHRVIDNAVRGHTAKKTRGHLLHLLKGGSWTKYLRAYQHVRICHRFSTIQRKRDFLSCQAPDF